MIKLVIKILLITLSLPIFSVDEEKLTPKFPAGKGAELIGDLKEGKIYGSLKHMAQNKANTIQLVGHAYMQPAKDPTLAGNTMVLIGWLGVQKINEPQKIVGFKEPIVSSFMFKTGTEITGVALPTFGEAVYLEQAIDDLEHNKFDIKDLKKLRTIKAPIGQNDDFVVKLISPNTKIQPVKLDQANNDLAAIHEVQISDLVNNNISGSPSSVAIPRSSGYGSFADLGSHSLPNFQNQNPDHRTNIRFGDQHPQDQKPAKVGPDVTLELTEEGCMPEHDALQEKVIITAKTRKFENGKLVEEGACERTLECYPVKRDYLCEQCIDEINVPERKAYARYLEHWFDKGTNRHNLELKVDRNPFAIIEDHTGCGYQVVDDYCSKMSKLGYFNKFGLFKVVEDCRLIEDTPRFPVRNTMVGCPRIHDFVNNVSTIQSRSFFTKNGREHTVAGCTPIGEADHIFTDLGCHPIHHVNNKFIYFVRRMIVIDGRQEIITQECEPNPQNGINAWANLLASSDECRDQYLHDFDAGKSYLKKRYFYYDPRRLPEHNKIYVTPCVRSHDFLEHQYQHEDRWEHDDEKLGSRAKLATYINVNGTMVKIDVAKIRGNEELEPYTLAEVQENNKIFHVYTRADGSIYRKFVRDVP